VKCRICGLTIGVTDQRSYVRLYKGDTDCAGMARKVYACSNCQGAFDRWIDSLPVDEDGRPIDVCRNEAKALLIAADRQALLKRLRAARSVLAVHVRRSFGEGRFDFDKRTLTGDNGMVLRWKTRHIPDKPVAYRNQQTNIGIVELQ